MKILKTFQDFIYSQIGTFWFCLLVTKSHYNHRNKNLIMIQSPDCLYLYTDHVHIVAIYNKLTLDIIIMKAILRWSCLSYIKLILTYFIKNRSLPKNLSRAVFLTMYIIICRDTGTNLTQFGPLISSHCYKFFFIILP